MSEYCREQHPLLCEEASEEETYSPRYLRRVHPLSFRGRARINHKGAAAILTRWPDHWSSFLTYWWIGIGMISLTTFIIYNSLFAFSVLPSANTKPTTPVTTTTNVKTTMIDTSLPDIFMHVFANQNEDIDLNLYMPYIEIISSSFLDFKFNFIVVINDTNVGWMSAEENNELALNMLWNKDKNVIQKEFSNRNVNIEHVSLTAYMDNSPLKKYWRALPPHLIEFLARTVAIWDKGGVAFNPDILTPRSQHTLYIEKLQNILNKYARTNKIINYSKLANKSNKTIKKSKKLNNIRDIINALENEDISANAFPQQTLSEAENRDIQFIRHERHVTSNSNNKDKYVAAKHTESLEKESPEIYQNILNKSHVNNIVKSTESMYPLEISHNSTKMSLIPLFLEFLFHNKADIRSKPTEAAVFNRTRKSATALPKSDEFSTLSNNALRETGKGSKSIYKPVIVTASGIYNKSQEQNITNVPHNKQSQQVVEANRLTIDLKGNVIATDTACHAFLGTIYSNVIHHNEEETITDFIIAELTIFCKGLLSSCMGIDLILL